MPYTGVCSSSNRLNLLNHHRNQVDRFIPNLVSSANFHGLSGSHSDDTQVAEDLQPGFLDRPPYFSGLRPETPPPSTNRSPATSDPSTPTSDISSVVSKKGYENKEVAKALNMSENPRVYGFQHKTPPGSRSPVASLKHGMSEVPLRKPAVKQAKKFPQITNPFRVLDAPGLRNDFYANLISWSKVTNKIAVGLDKVFIWADDGQVAPLRSLLTEAITCVSYAPCTTFLAVGTKAGRLYLYDNASLICSTITKPNSSVCCIHWTNTGKELFIGDDTGNVLYYEIKQTYCSYDLMMRNSWNCHQQQICGIAINADNTQITVGANDNCCTVWDIHDIKAPKLRFILPHFAAVKAIAYCPWAPSLLATGAGSKDRMIRFWHSNSGTLLDSYNTKGQITSIIWSVSSKQLLVSFGFTDFSSPLLMSVYSYPKMEILINVPATCDLRVLSAVPSPDGKSVCIVANDETVRFYHIWGSKYSLTLSSQTDGIFGSTLLELAEGVGTGADNLR